MEYIDGYYVLYGALGGYCYPLSFALRTGGVQLTLYTLKSSGLTRPMIESALVGGVGAGLWEYFKTDAITNSFWRPFGIGFLTCFLYTKFIRNMLVQTSIMSPLEGEMATQ